MSEEIKLCLCCQHFYYAPGRPGFSDQTPGDDAVMECLLGLMKIDLWKDYLADYRAKMATAQTCKRLKQLDPRGEV